MRLDLFAHPTVRSFAMRRLNSRQRQMLIEMARALEDTTYALQKRTGRLARHGVMPPFIRELVASAQTTLDHAAAGLVDWADGSVDDHGVPTTERTETLQIDIAGDLADEDVGN